MNKCLNCGKDVNNKYCNTSCQNVYRGKMNKLKPIKTNELVCIKCGESYVTDKKYKKNYCSIKCSKTRNFTTETKNKISNTLKEKNIKVNNSTCQCCGKNYYVRPSKINTTKYCSRECCNNSKNYKEMASKGGLASAKIQSEIKRSKNEIYFSELCIKHFKNVKTNENLFNGWDADVIIEDIKCAVLWNGKWHYEKITKKHSVLQVQNRDEIKIKEIVNCGYQPYIIKDMGKYKRKFVEEQFRSFLNYITTI
jgi:RNase P/RNase MRP subunit p29